MKSGVKLFTIIQISIFLVVSVTIEVSAQEFWEEQFEVPGAYSSSGDNINDMITTENGVFVTGLFGSVDGIRTNSIAYWNGSTWEALGKGLTFPDGSIAEGYELHINNGLLYVVGDFTNAGDSLANNFAAWDISNKEWISFPGEFNATVNTITSSGSNIYIGGDFSQIDGNSFDHIAVWDGENWNAFQGGVNGDVNKLRRSNGQLYVGGDFSMAGGLAVSNLAIWTGTQWTDFNGGANGEIYDILIKGDSILVGGNFGQLNGSPIEYLGILNEGIWIDFPVQPNEVVYNIESFGLEIAISGEFDQIGVLQTNGFAIWDGASWQVPNAELTSFSSINSSISYNNEWVVGGEFTGTENEVLNNIARLASEMEWEKFGLEKSFFGVNGTILTIEPDNNSFYVGGSFTGIGNQAINRLAKWNGNNWESLGESPSGSINDILVDDNLVYVAGTFSTIGGISANRIAVWNKNTNQWSALAGGASSAVRSLLKIGNSIYAAGSFTQMDGIAVNRIAEWDGNNWSALGNGVDGTIYSLIEYNGKIYVGGTFANAGAVPANNIASWNGSIWENLDTGLDGTVYSLAKTDTSIFVGGDFENSPDGSTRNIAEWISGANSWKEVGEGFDDLVRSLYIKGDSLYAGGRFTQENIKGGEIIIGGNKNPELNGIALWNKTGLWQTLDSGFSKYSNTAFNVYDIKPFEEKLIVGGVFDLAGTAVSSNFAIWNEGKISISTEEFEAKSLEFKLHQNYPNPFNPTTNIGFELSEPGLVKLSVYNMLGQEITTLVNKRLTAGNYEYTFDASGLSSGLYIYKIRTNSTELTKKMMLIK